MVEPFEPLLFATEVEVKDVPPRMLLLLDFIMPGRMRSRVVATSVTLPVPLEVPGPVPVDDAGVVVVVVAL